MKTPCPPPPAPQQPSSHPPNGVLPHHKVPVRGPRRRALRAGRADSPRMDSVFILGASASIRSSWAETSFTSGRAAHRSSAWARGCRTSTAVPELAHSGVDCAASSASSISAPPPTATPLSLLSTASSLPMNDDCALALRAPIRRSRALTLAASAITLSAEATVAAQRSAILPQPDPPAVEGSTVAAPLPCRELGRECAPEAGPGAVAWIPCRPRASACSASPAPDVCSGLQG